MARIHDLINIAKSTMNKRPLSQRERLRVLNLTLSLRHLADLSVANVHIQYEFSDVGDGKRLIFALVLPRELASALPCFQAKDVLSRPGGQDGKRQISAMETVTKSPNDPGTSG